LPINKASFFRVAGRIASGRVMIALASA